MVCYRKGGHTPEILWDNIHKTSWRDILQNLGVWWMVLKRDEESCGHLQMGYCLSTNCIPCGRNSAQRGWHTNDIYSCIKHKITLRVIIDKQESSQDHALEQFIMRRNEPKWLRKNVQWCKRLISLRQGNEENL